MKKIYSKQLVKRVQNKNLIFFENECQNELTLTYKTDINLTGSAVPLKSYVG